MTQPMTKSEWVKASFKMAWSIYNTEGIAAFRNALSQSQNPPLTWQEIRLDLSAPPRVPDGVHNVLHQSAIGRAYAGGVVVKDGRFVPEPTQQAVFNSQNPRRLRVLQSRARNGRPARRPPARTLLHRRIPLGPRTPMPGGVDQLLNTTRRLTTHPAGEPII